MQNPRTQKWEGWPYTKVGGVALLRLKLRVQRRMLGERTEKEEVSWARTADLGLKPREPSHQ